MIMIIFQMTLDLVFCIALVYFVPCTVIAHCGTAQMPINVLIKLSPLTTYYTVLNCSLNKKGSTFWLHSNTCGFEWEARDASSSLWVWVSSIAAGRRATEWRPCKRWLPRVRNRFGFASASCIAQGEGPPQQPLLFRGNCTTQGAAQSVSSRPSEPIDDQKKTQTTTHTHTSTHTYQN